MSDNGANKSAVNWERFNLIFEQVFEHSLIGMAILDSNGHFLRVNKKACEIWEYKESELIGKTWNEITYKDDISLSTHFVDSYKNKSIEYNMVIEKRYNTGFGNIKTCKITTTALRDSNNQIEYFITQVQDVTQKKEALCSLQKGLDFIKEMRIKHG